MKNMMATQLFLTFIDIVNRVSPMNNRLLIFSFPEDVMAAFVCQLETSWSYWRGSRLV